MRRWRATLRGMAARHGTDTAIDHAARRLAEQARTIDSLRAQRIQRGTDTP